MSVHLRSATPADRDIIFAWRNDPYLVARSSSRREITREEHDAWFGKLLEESRSLVFVVEVDGQPCGQVRLELKGEHCVITAYLVPAATGKGHGVEAIRAGCMAAAARWPNIPVLACVRNDNKAGISSFSKAGFYQVPKGCPADHVAMVFARPAEEVSAMRRYTDLLQTHGESHRALDWGSRQGQALRFRVLAEVSDLNGRSVLDAGCGLGDFAAWLAANGVKADYTGLDLTPALVERARILHPGLPFHQGSVADPSVLAGRRFDFVVASGIFTTYRNDGPARMRDYMMGMWNLASEGVAFNTLSTWSTDPEPGEFHADPVHVLSLAHRLSPWVVLRHDYHPRDFTVYILRSPA